MMGAGALTDKAVVMIELPARLGRNGYLDAGEGGASLRAAEPRPRHAPQDRESDRGIAGVPNGIRTRVATLKEL